MEIRQNWADFNLFQCSWLGFPILRFTASSIENAEIEILAKIRQFKKNEKTLGEIHFQRRLILSKVQKYFRKRLQMNPIEDLKSMKNM